MSRLTARTWNIPQLTVLPPARPSARDPQDSGLSDCELLDPGPLGLVAARIQLFDRREQDTSGRTRSAQPPLPNEGASANQKGSRTLGYQAKKAKKIVPEYVTISRYQPPNNALLGYEPFADNSRRTRLSTIFNSTPVNKEAEKLEELYQKLTGFSVFGLPRLAEELRELWEIREGQESRICLPSSWRDIVKGHEKMSRKQAHQQEAIWELLHTEVTYLRKLKIITDLFISGLLNLQSSGILQEVEPRRIFSNIEQIIRLHREVWQEVLAPVLEEAQISGMALDPLRLCQGLQTFPERFHAYIHYCLSEAHCLQYTHVTQQNNKLFAMYVKWAETHKQSNRMRLSDMLVKPHQRLTKYPLLLKAILKKTEDAKARETISSTLFIVESFIRRIDSQMQVRDERQKLEVIANRFSYYDVVESSSEEVDKIVKEFSFLDLTLPMVGISPHCVRLLLLEGNLKMKEGRDSKTEVHCLLFSDLLLITKPLKKGNRGKVIRQPLMIDKIVSRELKDPGSFLLLYVNELHSVIAAYTFVAPSSSLCKDWLDTLSTAQKQLELHRSREAWMCQEQFKQMQEEIRDNLEEDRTPSIPDCGIPSEGGSSPSGRSLPVADPQLPPTAPDFAEPPAQEPERSGVSPSSPRRLLPGRGHLQARVGAQRAIKRRLRKENGSPGPRRRPEGPEIQAQEAEREQAEGPGFQAQEAEREQAEGLEIQAQEGEEEQAEGPEIQAQEAEREQAEGLEIQAQEGEEEQAEGPEIQAQEAEREQAEGLEIQAQEAEREQAEGPGFQAQEAEQKQAEGPGFQAQEAEREKAKSLGFQAQEAEREQAEPAEERETPPRLRDEPQPLGDSQPESRDRTHSEMEEGDSSRLTVPSPVMETLRRAKQRAGNLSGQARDIQDRGEGGGGAGLTSGKRTLTISELQRIRTSLQLNSTLSISEV